MKSVISFLVVLLVVNAHSSNIPLNYYEQKLGGERETEEQEEEEDAFEVYTPIKLDAAAEDDDMTAALNEMNEAVAVEQAGGINTFDLTTFRQPFTYNCPPGAALSYMYSRHLNSQEDRQWRFGCRKISNSHITGHCTWSANHNFDQPLQGMCAEGRVVTGFRSLQYSVGHRDRRFNVRCCKTNVVETCCTTTDYINNWDAVMNYNAPANKIISGIYSEHNNGREDRRFKVKICDLKKSFYDCTC